MIKQYEVKIDGFEGPLDLLLHLVNKLEVDIYDIPVAQITEQYTEYIKQMQFLELNIASEYLVMAATLIELKSKMLLPTEEVILDELENEEDPREELRERLIQYREFKKIASTLQEKEGHLLFTRPLIIPKEEAKETHDYEQTDVTVYDMLDALSTMMKRKKWNEPLSTKVEKIGLTVHERMNEMVEVLRNCPNGVQFDEMFVYKDKGHIVTTFIALLELIKNRTIICEQKNHFTNIQIFLA